MLSTLGLHSPGNGRAMDLAEWVVKGPGAILGLLIFVALMSLSLCPFGHLASSECGQLKWQRKLCSLMHST